MYCFYINRVHTCGSCSFVEKGAHNYYLSINKYQVLIKMILGELENSAQQKSQGQQDVFC